MPAATPDFHKNLRSDLRIENNLYFCSCKQQTQLQKIMETVTITFSPNIPFAARIDAFLKTVPPGVKVSKSVKPRRKRRSNYQITLDTIREAREGKNLNHYASAEELFEKLGI